jgi:hypothetical protein
MGAPESRRPEEDRTSPFRAAEGAPPAFTVFADGPALELRPEWLGNPKAGTPQRTFGKNMERERQDARLEPLRGPRQEGRNTPKEENNPALRDEREAPPARFRMEGDDWNDSPWHRTPPRVEGLEGFPMQLQLPPVAPAQMERHQSNREGRTESRTRAEGESASISLNFPGQAPRAEATFNPPTGPLGYAGSAPTGPAQQSWAPGPPTASGPTPFYATNVQWTQYPQYPAQAPVLYAQGYWVAGQGPGPPILGNAQQYNQPYPAVGAGASADAGAGPPGRGGPPGYPPAYPYAPPPPAWNQPPYGAHASQPTKVFQPFKTKIFKGVRGEKGAKARRFVKIMEMYRDSTPEMTQSQMGVTMYANMDDTAKDWIHAEDEEYKRAKGGMLLLHNWEELRRRFLERWGEVNPAESLERLENLAQGKDEEVVSLASRARELFEEAHQYDEKIMIHKFMKALHAPLQQGLQTRGADTFERAVKVAIELEDGIWAMSDYKSSRAEKQGGDIVRLAEKETPRVNSSAVSAPPAPTARPDPCKDCVT